MLEQLIDRLHSILPPPRQDDPESNRRARWMHAYMLVLIMLTAGALSIEGIVYLFVGRVSSYFYALLPTLLWFVLMLFIQHYGYLRLVGYCLSLGVVAVTTGYILSNAQTVNTSAVIGYFLTIPFAALMVSNRAMILTTISSTICSVGIFFAENVGLLSPAMVASTADLLILIFLLLIALILHWVYTRFSVGQVEEALFISETRLQEMIEQAVVTERRLLQSQKAESLGVLAGGIAHDFNNLLVAIQGQTSLALVKNDPDSPATPHIRKAVNATQKAASLTKQMLAYSGRGNFEVQTVDINQLIRENLELLRVSIPHHVEMATNLTSEQMCVEVDLAQIQQLVMNLIINAGEAIENRVGKIEIATEPYQLVEPADSYHTFTDEALTPGAYVEVRVADNGPGIPKQTVSRIFEPFFTTKKGGSGLGLAAAVGILKAHEGALKVASIPQEGTTFSFILPISLPAAGSNDFPSNSSPGEMQDGQILVIDDDEAVRETAVDILTLAGFEVLTAQDGETGIKLYERHPGIHGILLDLSMPGIGGESTYRILRGKYARLPILVASGYSDGAGIAGLQQDPFASFLHKPYTAAELKGRMLELIHNGS